RPNPSVAITSPASVSRSQLSAGEAEALRSGAAIPSTSRQPSKNNAAKSSHAKEPVRTSTRATRARTELPEFLLPEEVSTPSQYIEGAVRRISINAYERDKRARAECLSRHGYRCAVCDFSFAEVYGEIGE